MFADEWPPIAERLAAVEERYRANRVRAKPQWPPGDEEMDRVRADVLRLARLYPAADESERREVQTFFGATDFLVREPLAEVGGLATQHFRETGDAEWLDVALAVCSMQDLRDDYRDTYVWLGSLYRTAVRHGIDPGPRFAAAAALSSPEARDGLSTRRFLAEFERSAYFAASVAPNL